MNVRKEDYPQKLREIGEFHDKIVKANIDDESDETVKQNIERFQVHNCSFTCAKKRKTLTIEKDEGWAVGVPVPSHATALVKIPVCRFGLPRFPIDKTVALLGFSADEDEEVVKQAKMDNLKIRKYLLRQCFTPKGSKREEQPGYIALTDLDFKTFLRNVGMFQGIHHGTEDDKMTKARMRYHTALRVEIKGQLKVFPKRNLKSLFVNNFHPKLMQLHPANHDVQYVTDPYSAAHYVSDYLTKNESGMSALLKKVDEEYKSLPAIEIVKKFAAVLDNHREVSIQECVYRLLGLPMSRFSVVVKFLSTSHPNQRDGLLRSDLEEIKDDDSVFYPSPHQYYESRPDTWEDKVGGQMVEIDGKNMCLADWFSKYDHKASGKPPKGGISFEGNRSGWFKRRGQRAVLRFFLKQEKPTELARALCILFLPFKNELRELHEKDPEELLAVHGDIINANKAKFIQSNNYIDEMIKRLEEEKEKGDEESSDEEDDVDDELETTEKYQIELHQKDYDRSQAKRSLPKDNESASLSRYELMKQITSLNSQQRQLFDEICERITDENYESNPFYIYLAGEAGTGKSFLINVLVAAIKILTAQSGQDLDKPATLVLAPSATAAFLVNGKTCESGLQFYMGKKGGYSPGNAADMTRLAFEYEDVALCVFEEISMIGNKKFSVMNERLKEIAHGEKRMQFMGGKSVLAVGDFRQVK